MDERTVKVYLDEVKKYRSENEYRKVSRITCPEFQLQIVGDGRLCRKMAVLLATKCDISRGYEVLRGDTLCFEVKPLKTWIKDKRPEQFK